MKADHAAIAKIFLDEVEAGQFCGTGFLIAPNYVLACAHSFLGDYSAGWANWKPDNDSDELPGLTLSFGDDAHGVPRQKGKLIACDLPDLALIELTVPVTAVPLPLLAELTAEHEAALAGIHGSVIGFSKTDGGKLVQRPVEGYVSLAWNFHTKSLLTIQISGHLPPGMSGSPLIIECGNRAVCLGMAHLGGDGSATSRLILSSVMLGFLAQQRIVPPVVVKATNCIGQGQAGALAVALDRLMKALHQFLTSEYSGDDRNLLQESLLSGTLSFSSGNQRATPGTTSEVVISGKKHRIIVQVDEESGMALGEKLFPSPLGVAPPAPSVFFVGRSRDIVAVKSLLRDPHKPDSAVIVQGWPGVGKSSFTAVLGRDAELMASFPDGVLWTAVGQSPNLFSSLAAWGRWLGIQDILRMPTLQDAVGRLQRELESRRMLLIADDVWSTEDALPFLGLRSKNCRLLITSRRPAITEELTTIPVAPYNLPVLGEEDALQLLWNLAAEVVEKNLEMCRVLLKDIEYLPLAIHVAGRLLRSEAKLWSVEELIEGIRSGAEIIRAKAPEDRAEEGNIPTVSALLARSTDSLDERTREYFAYLGAFAPKPATFDLEAMKAVWQEQNPKPFVRKLVGQGLLEPVPNGRFQMHALLVAHACSMLTDEDTV